MRIGPGSGNWIHEWQHIAFRVISVGFALVSAHAVLWFFSGLNEVDSLQVWVGRVFAAALALLSFFTSRGLAYRLRKKMPTRSYWAVMALIVLVELVCNFGESAASWPAIRWVHGLGGWQYLTFSWLVPLVLSSTPLFNMALSNIDMDLAAEQEERSKAVPKSVSPGAQVPVSPAGGGATPGRPAGSPASPSAPKQPGPASRGQGSSSSASVGQPTLGLPQAVYPAMMPSPSHGSVNGRGPQPQQPNALGTYYQHRSAGNGAPAQAQGQGQGQGQQAASSGVPQLAAIP